MTRPDLSFLFRSAQRPPAERTHAPPPGLPERRQPGRPADAVGALIDELRASQAELETQNKVLRFSQAAAESASERFETLFSSVPLSLMVLDEHDMVVQANSMAHRSFQPSEADRPLVALMPFVRADDAPRVRAAFDEARAAGSAEVTEVVFHTGEHARITGDLHIARIETPQGDGPVVPQFLCAVIDQGPLLAERRALQDSAATLKDRNAQILASERRLEAVINSALDAIICVDQNHRITVFNPTASALFVCTQEDALGSALERFLPDAAQAMALSQLTTQAVLGEVTARTATGRDLPVEVSLSFENQGEGTSATVFARDLTGRKKAEAHRNELEAQLRESHKMQAVGTMAGGIAHDFNNILGAILGNVELAKADAGAESPVLESLEEIQKAGRRARDLVRQILTFSRNEPPKRAPVSVPEAVNDTVRLLRVTVPPGVDVQVRIDPDVPDILADPTQVEQALLNLCTNALHALGDQRGTVLLQAVCAQPDARICERLAIPPGDYVCLRVSDNGPGMDAATQQRIFEPFFTTKPVGQGTGLGLAVVHGVMRTHGGAVDVYSVPGEGSSFTLYFPGTSHCPSGAGDGGAFCIPTTVPTTPPAPDIPSQSRASGATPVDAGGPQQRQRHVMYVDDDQALVFLVQRLLRRRGYRVSGFTDPHEATAALRADPEAYDLVVTDYNMPGYCGVDLVREAKRIRPALPVALASGYVTADIERAALAEGANALIHKPNDVEELCATVQRLAHGPAGDEAPDESMGLPPADASGG
ncbi:MULTISPECIES: ATP-binding protein [unclassified Acidovorax]|uniref:PAS domain-containing hybrid sensor histidine kinase/response regulator n=1 Tax=unclassified Acidovorax TaxID=2684926 RepID=UPI0028832494|nr:MULTISPECIES: ATP-binding protein [unclassified Acidovorax]